MNYLMMYIGLFLTTIPLHTIQKPIDHTDRTSVIRMGVGTIINIDTLIHATGSIAQAFATLYNNDATIIYFYTPWCSACKKIKPYLETLAKKYPKIYFVSINAELYESFIEEYNITTTPTLLFMKNGELIGRNSGYENIVTMESLITKIFS